MKGIFRALFAFFLCMICIIPPAFAVNTNITLRIGLYYGSTALSAIPLESKGGFSVGTVSGTVFQPASSISDEKITVTSNGVQFTVTNAAGKVVYTATGEHIALRAASGLTKCKEYTYHGDFVLRQSSTGSMTTINYVAMEDYVKGVLPYEVSASWPAEALKAQAVCARSYALGNLNKHKTYGFDLCNTTNCQVYRGIERSNAASDAAVDATAGQYLEANGKLAVGYFFSSDGGATEDNENVWGGDPVSYLRGVKDPYEDVKSAYNGSWNVTLTADQVAAKLKSAGHSIGAISKVEVTKRTAMDNVNTVTVTDTSGKSVTLKNSAVRTAFGLNSIRYTINGGGSSSNESGGLWVNGARQTGTAYFAIGGSKQTTSIGSASGKTVLTATGKQTLSVASPTAPPATTPANSYTFTGTGWGHNVGMSQYGALAMAKQNFTYDQILKFYFTGIKIVG